MNDFYNLDTFPEYVKLLNSQPKVPDQDFEPIIFDNLLSTKEHEFIKQEFDNIKKEDVEVQGFAGLGTVPIKMLNKDEIIKKVEKLASEAYGEELVVLEVGGTRYSPEFGWEVKFGPHYDARPVEIFVFDYHVQSTQDWGFFVEGKKYNFKDNQALMFCGTGKVHWREPIVLEDNAKIDLIFFWMQHKNPKPISQEHIDLMKIRTTVITDHIEPFPGLARSDWWKSIVRSENIKDYPDFRKISAEKTNPLSHNTLYKNIITEKDLINLIELSKHDELNLNIDNDLKNRLINFMTHIHAESSIKFKDAFIFKAKKDMSLNKLDTDNSYSLVSLAVPLVPKLENEVLVDQKSFKFLNYSGLTFSHTHQDLLVNGMNVNEGSIDFFIVNFYLENYN